MPPIRFADARGARLAYQDFGDGPATVISIPPLAQNIEMAWEWPEIRAMLERFGSFARFIFSRDFGAYIGFRVGIAENGRWMFALAGD